jgi:TolB protein
MKPDGSDKLLVPTPTAQAMAPMYSPDGTRITYVGEDADATKRIHIMNADGTHDAAITDGSTLVFQPAWSPDGLKLAYVEVASDGSNNYDIYIVNANGAGKVRLTSAPAVDVFPVWRP